MTSCAALPILTSTLFSTLAPNPTDPPYSFAGLCTAITDWNADSNNSANQIFAGATELDRKNELAAFLGNTLHESGDFVYPREITPCGDNVDVGGTLYCKPTGYTSNQGAYTDPYCSTSHTTVSNPDGCNCGAVTESVGNGYEANKLFFGRGPIQLSWNYNYIDAGAALNKDLCTNPDLVATDPATAWGTAIWFWMSNTGSTGTSCHTAVTTNGSFGQALNTINGGLECVDPVAHGASVVSRLDDYCRAADQLGVAVLSFDGCPSLQTIYDSCISGGAGTYGACTSCDGITSSPTTSPTKSPSIAPTVPVPTTSPTESPTKSPTSSPTSPPTIAPTVPPPTTSPTESPTKSPTSSPTPKPTRSPTPFLWYPDWSGANKGCVADGEEPTYMTLNPSEFMYTEQSTCCSTHYNWMYETCMGIDATGETVPVITTGSGLYFPDWSTTTNTCKLDEGDAPSYMRINPTTWMSATQADCCTSYFNWNYIECAGSAASGGSAPTTPVTAGLYYPNWEQGTDECLNDDNQPAYMSNDQAHYMHSTLESCCQLNYFWALNDCLGVANSGTSKWYMDWAAGNNGACVQDCPTGNGGSCGGHAQSWNELYSSKSDCCTTRKSWDGDCLST